MADNNLVMNLENDTIEDHLASLVEKLETMRETSGGPSKRYRPPFQVEIRTLHFWRAIISECMATFFFVFVVSGAEMFNASKLPGGYGSDNVVATALAAGFAMAVLSQCFGNVSGGHVNPAVSLAAAATKKISPTRALMFVIAQCGGGIAGAALIYGINPVTQYPGTYAPILGSWKRFGYELVLAFIIVFTHCSVAERKLCNNGAAMIGSAYIACSVFGLSMLNPARALGSAFVMNRLWENHWVFWIGPVVGGILAAFIHEYIFNLKRPRKRSKDSIHGDSSSIQSEDEPFDDSKYHAAYRPVGSGNATSPGGAYCPSVASASVYSSPPVKGDKYGKPAATNFEGIYSGSRSLYNAKINDGIYSGTKSMYTKSPSLTRANLNRSQSVYAKSQNPRDLLPKPGPLIPAQSLYPIKLGNGGHLGANMRDFGSPNGNFIAGVKTNDGNFVKVPPMNAGFNQNALSFLAGRSGGSKSYHDITDASDKAGMLVHQSSGNTSVNQNVQNQHLHNMKAEKAIMENIYGIRNSPTGGIYPGNEAPRQESDKREGYDLIVRAAEGGRQESFRSQTTTNLSRTAAYVKSVQSNAGCKPRDSNYDIVPSGMPNFAQKPHNRSETSDYGSNRSDASAYAANRSAEQGNRQEEDATPDNRKRSDADAAKKSARPELPIPPQEDAKNEGRGCAGSGKMQFQMSAQNFGVPVAMPSQQWSQMPTRAVLPSGNKSAMPHPSPNGLVPGNPVTSAMNYVSQSRQSPLSSVSSSSFSRNSPNPAY